MDNKGTPTLPAVRGNGTARPDRRAGDAGRAARGSRSAWAVRIIGGLLLAYVVGSAVFGYYHYDHARQLLLRVGAGQAGADLAGMAALLAAPALLLPAWLRVLSYRARPRDWAFILFLPLFAYALSWLPVYFDASSGQALRYCAERPGGDLFCLDHAGVDPQTGRPLVLMNPRTAELQYKRSKNLRPRLITRGVDGVEFFDGLDGRPRVYFASDGSGCYRIYDQPGMDPQTGQPLAPATAELVQRLRQCRRAAAERARPARPAPVAPAVRGGAAMTPRLPAPAAPGARPPQPASPGAGGRLAPPAPNPPSVARQVTPRAAGRRAADAACTGAGSRVDILICFDDRLKALDADLVRTYQAALARSPRTAAQLRQGQARWMQQERNRCADATCLRQAYTARIQALRQYREPRPVQRATGQGERRVLTYTFRLGNKGTRR